MPIRLEVPPPTWLRVGCLLAFAAFLVKLFAFDEPRILAQLTTIVWDKLMHAIAFGTLAAMLWFVLGFDAPTLGWLLVTAIGAVDEFHQVFVPGRTADVLDLAADALGAAIAIFVLQRLARASRRPPCAESSAPSRGATWCPSSSKV